MPQELTQFRKDLANPSSGLNSDLYRAISPIVSADNELSLPKDDQRKIDSLKEDVRKGLVGLEYMTGIKKNKGETFYDEHPAQALAADALRNAPLFGLGLAGGGVLLNSIRQKQNLDKVMPAAMARMGNTPDKDLSNPQALLNPREGTIRGDIAKIYGEADSPTRMQLIDRLSDVDPKDKNSLSKQLSRIEKTTRTAEKEHLDKLKNLNDQLLTALDDREANKISKQIEGIKKLYDEQQKKTSKTKSDLLSSARSSKGSQYLDKHVNFHEALQRAKEKGGFSSPLGAGLNLPDFIAPDKHQALVDLIERMEMTKAHPGFNRDLLLQSVSDFLDDPAELARFERTSLPKIMSHDHQGSGLGRFLSRNKFPLIAGAATAAGGTGLYYLIKALQKKMHSEDKVKDWKKTLLKSQGDFEGANRIK
jgi:hypothetical protein